MAIFNGADAASIKQSCRAVATEIERSMIRWKYFADSINTITAADMTALGLTTEEQTYIGSLRVALLNIDAKYRNQAPANGDNPSYFVKLFSALNVM
jgi:hypothetical protein